MVTERGRFNICVSSEHCYKKFETKSGDGELEADITCTESNAVLSMLIIAGFAGVWLAIAAGAAVVAFTVGIVLA